MAQQTIVQLTDDLSGGEAHETVSFQLDGVEYEIDLSTDNAKRLREDLADYVAAARRLGGRSKKGVKLASWADTSSKESKAKQMRRWAVDNGFEVPARGRLPQEIKDAYEAAHGGVGAVKQSAPAPAVELDEADPSFTISPIVSDAFDEFNASV